MDDVCRDRVAPPTLSEIIMKCILISSWLANKYYRVCKVGLIYSSLAVNHSSVRYVALYIYEATIVAQAATEPSGGHATYTLGYVSLPYT